MKPASPETITFYRAVGKYGFLSNLFRRLLVFEGREFRSAEDAYQYGKARRREVAEWLVSAPSPHLCALAAHALFAYDVVPDWQTAKLVRMRGVLEAKFSMNADLQRELLATGDATLVEASKMDSFWGTGARGKGKNMLGQLLIEVREKYRAALWGAR